MTQPQFVAKEASAFYLAPRARSPKPSLERLVVAMVMMMIIVDDDDGDDDDVDDDDDDLYIIGAVCVSVSKSHYLCIQRIYFSGWEFFFFFEFFC